MENLELRGGTCVAAEPLLVARVEGDEPDEREQHAHDAPALLDAVYHEEPVEALEEAHDEAEALAPAGVLDVPVALFHHDHGPRDHEEEVQEERDDVALHVLAERGVGAGAAHVAVGREVSQGG